MLFDTRSGSSARVPAESADVAHVSASLLTGHADDQHSTRHEDGHAQEHFVAGMQMIKGASQCRDGKSRGKVRIELIIRNVVDELKGGKCR